MMQLSFKSFEGRSCKDVIDADTGQIVGHIRSKNAPVPGFEISLFDRKYEATLATYEECRGFVRGVQAVLRTG